MPPLKQNRGPLPSHPCQLLQMPWRSLCCGRWMCSLENSALKGCLVGNILKMGIPPSLLPTACGSERERAQNLSPQGLAALQGKAGGEEDKL